MFLTVVVFRINSIHLKDPNIVPEVFEMYHHSVTTVSLLIPGDDYSLVGETKYVS